MKRLLSFCLAVVVCCLVGRSGLAQGFVYDAGNPSYGVNIPIENGFINVTNGNLHMEIHLAQHPQRGALHLDEKLVYDSHFWEIGHYSQYYWWPDNVPRTSQMAMGWRFVTGAETGTITQAATVSTGSCMGINEQTKKYNVTNYIFTWHAPDGTGHTFGNGYSVSNSSGCDDGTGTAESPQPESSTGSATDASGYTMTASGTDHAYPTITIRDLRGTQVYPQVIDRYGNYWSLDGNGNLVDDRGQTPVLVSSSGNQIFYDVLAPGGGRARYTVTTANYPLNTHFGQQAVNDYSGTLPSISSIQLPDGSSYSFTYELYYGELSGVTLPTGGTIQYGWLTFFDSYNNANRWVASRTVGSDPATTFTPNTVTACASNGTGCQEKMVVHEPSGDETLYNLTVNNGVWNTNTQHFAGAVSNGTLLTSMDTAYNFSNPCSTGCLGAQYVTASSVTSTLNDVGLKMTDVYSYANPTLGLLSSKKRYDFYSGSLPNTPVNEIDYAYGSTVSGDITSTTTKDGVGNILALETRTYGAASSATSGLPQHGAINAAGSFLTSVGEWLNTDGTSVMTSYRWDDAGTLIAASAPYSSSSSASGWATYGYDSTDALPTSETEPAVPSGIALGMSAGVDASFGVPTSTIDYNGKTTTLKTYDAVGRVGEIDSPDGGVTKISYSPNTKQTTTQVDSARQAVNVQSTDPFGRTERTATANGQASNPWYQQDTCYDANGRVSAIGTPYAGPGFGAIKNCSGTSYTYDALGRVLTIQNADGTGQYKYTGRATRNTDVNGVSTIRQVDGLGRLTAICEISGNTQGSASPQNCGLDIAGTGYLTTYSYDLPNHRTYVSQGGQGRIFGTDSLGRPVLTSEPERGTTTYSYAYNATGLLTTRTRPRANVPVGNTQQTHTASQYDNLGRLVSVTYDDGATPAKRFYYDQNYSLGLQGTSSNVKGLLAGAVSGSGSTATAFQYSYDVMSRVVNMWQCAPSTCAGQYARPMVSRVYDLEGNLTFQFDGASGGIAYGRSIAGEITSITNQTYTDKNNPPNLVSSVVNGPFGPTSWVLGNGLGVAVGYDTLGRINQNSFVTVRRLWAAAHSSTGTPEESLEPR